MRFPFREPETPGAAAGQGHVVVSGWSERGWRKPSQEEIEMEDKARPTTDVVVLNEETKVKHPDTGETVTLAAGTTLSDATAQRLGLKGRAKAKS